MLLSPTQRAVLRGQGQDGIAGTIVAPANQVYTIFLVAPFDGTIVSLATQTSAGTLTVAVKIAGVAVAGLSAVSVTSVALISLSTQFSLSAWFNTGDLIALDVTAVAGAADFAFVIDYVRPAGG